MVSGFSPLLLAKKDLMTHYGQSSVLEPRHFQSTSLELTALASGEADIVSLGYSTLAVAVLNAHLDDVRVVADANDVALRWMLHQHGLEDKRDYSTIESDYANMPAMLMSRKAALIIGANPWALNPELQRRRISFSPRPTPSARRR
jgi:sulfonate transport system substrate-binding protein